jgi:fructose/tagatose bisphosphate aldolase
MRIRIVAVSVFKLRLQPSFPDSSMYVTKPRLFLDYALRNRFAFPSFNVCNLEIARGVIVAAEEENAPVMLQTYFGDLHYGGFNVLPSCCGSWPSKPVSRC